MDEPQLIRACRQERPRLVEMILASKADPMVTSAGQTALHCAKSAEIAKMLLDAKADPNAVDDTGFTPLWDAITNENIEVAKLLLENGADPNHALKSGYTLLMHMASINRLSCCVNLLTRHKADPNITEPIYGNTAFHIAINARNVYAAECLIARGGDPKIANKAGYTVAALAKKYGLK